MFESAALRDLPEFAPPEDDLPCWLQHESADLDVEALPPDPFCASPLTASELLTLAEAEPEFGAAASALARVDPAGLDECERVRYWTLCARVEAQVSGLRLGAVALVAGREPITDRDRLEDFSDCEVAAALRLSVNAATRQIHAARHLFTRLPATRAALASGEIGYLQALMIAEDTMSVDPAKLHRVEELVLAKAGEQSPGQTRTALRKAIARVDPEELAVREKAARKVTDARVWNHGEGTGELYGSAIPSAELALIGTGMEAFARSAKAQGDERTLGQLRVAALVTWATDYLTGPKAPRTHGRPYTVNVVIDLPTLLGLTDHPAEVIGGGMIPAYVARELVKDARLRRLITDPATGHLLDYGRKTYRAPADLADAVAARYVTTTGPGSTAPARTGDRDHDQSWSDGGVTSYDNLHPPGRRFHGGKTRGGWWTDLCRCGNVTWHSPKGATYTVEPHDYRLGP